jgi:Preprotein translocase subunit Sec66
VYPKFNLKLPAEVEEYYTIREKAEAAGWEPGQNVGPAASSNGPSRILAQALMKRAIADIPIVTHIQKESAGMNKLYAQSMCSVNQWRSYQAAEALVSAEVEEVRAEADEIEPGWSQVIWRQAMQYHSVLKQKHEEERKAAEELAKKRKEVEQRVQAAKAAEQTPTAAAIAAPPPPNAKPTPSASSADDEAARVKAAELAAEELIKMEEREKESKKAFSGGKTMKKGFLDGAKGKKKK